MRDVFHLNESKDQTLRYSALLLIVGWLPGADSAMQPARRSHVHCGENRRYADWVSAERGQMSTKSMSVLRRLLLLFTLVAASYSIARPDQVASQVNATPAPCPGPIGFSASTGRFPRTIHLSPPLMPFTSPLGAVQIDQRADRLYALSSPTDRYALGCGTLWVLDAQTGSVVARSPVPSPAGAPGLDNLDGKLLIPVLDAPSLYAPQSILDLDLSTHHVLRSQELGQVWQIYLVPKAHRAVLDTSSASCFNAFCARSPQLLDVATEKVSPFTKLPALGPAVIDNGRSQLFTLADGKVSAWDVSTGRQLWAHPLLTPCAETLVVATFEHRFRRLFTMENGTIERGDSGDDGYMCTFDAANGRRLNVSDVGFGAWPTILAVDGRRGVILADVRHYGNYPPAEDLEFLDPATGNVRRTLRGPHGATAAAVDPRTGRIFILAGPEKDGWSVWLLDPKTGRASQMVHGLKLGGNPLLYQVLVAVAARRVLVVDPLEGNITFLCADKRC